jgi:fermentation-respiration switch protein FrsA (DUF1100 family)
MKIHYIIIIIGILSVLSYLKNSLIYHPSKADNDKYDRFYQKVYTLATEAGGKAIIEFVQTSDGLLIDTLYMKNPDSDILVIFFHGNAGNLAMRYDMLKFIYNFASVLIFDYRSYGKSQGSLFFMSGKSLQSDALAVWSHAIKFLNYLPSKISLFGESLGCAVALELVANLSQTLNPLVYPHSIILNSPFYSLKSMIRIIFDKLRMGLIGGLPAMVYGTEYKSDLNIQYVNHITKIIIAHSPWDEIVPYKEGQKLYQLVAPNHPNVKFIKISGTHNNLNLTDGYIYALADLYQKN